MDSAGTEENNIDMNQYLTEQEAIELKLILQSYLKSYSENHDKMDVKEWLFNELKKDLPEKNDEEIKKIVTETDESIRVNVENLKSLREAKSRGISSEDWAAKKITDATAYMGLVKSGEYLENIENTLLEGNTKIYDSVLTKNGVPNMNPNMDGFIAEQAHVHSFNLNSSVNNTGFKAEVLMPEQGEIYSKNSFDIVIKDSQGNRVYQYQVKYGATAQDTINLIQRGNYNNQRILVPKEQLEEVRKAFPDKTVTDIIGGTDKVKVSSNSLTKEDVKKLQEKVQDGDVSILSKDWNDIAVWDLAKGIGKQAAFYGITSAALSAGFDIVNKLCKGEDLEAGEVIEVALRTGADVGVKFAVAGSIVVAAEKEFITVIPKGTPVFAIVNVVQIATENIKILIGIADGDLTFREGIERMEEVTVASITGIVSAIPGAVIGAGIGSLIGGIFGPIGMAAGAFIGEFVGGVVGYYLGEKIGGAITRTVQKVRNMAFELAKGIVLSGSKVINKVAEFVTSTVDGIVNIFSKAWNFVFG